MSTKQPHAIGGAVALAALITLGSIMAWDLPRIRVMKAQRLLRHNPTDFHARLLLANGLIERGEFGRAREILNALEALRIEDPFDLIGLGVAFLRAGDRERARLYLTRASASRSERVGEALQHILLDPMRAELRAVRH